MPEKFINIAKYLPNHKEKVFGNSPVLQIVPTTAEVDDLYEILLNVSEKLGTFKVYRNKDLPPRWHYHNDRRTGPITVVAKPTYAFQDMWKAVKAYEKEYKIKVTNKTEFGIHGYDNNLSSMNSLFMASGPAVKSGHRVDPFDTVDLFHLFCEILKIKPPVISGNRDNILDVLKGYEPPSNFMSTFMIILVSISVVIVFGAAIISTIMLIRRRRVTQTVPNFIYDDDPEDRQNTEEQKLLEINNQKEQNG